MDIKFSLTNYLNKGVENIMKGIVKASFQNPKETAFIMKYILASDKAVKKRETFEAKGQHIPPFLISSITSSCNLFVQDAMLERTSPVVKRLTKNK